MASCDHNAPDTGDRRSGTYGAYEQLSEDGCETRTEQPYGRARKYGDEQINDDYQ